jgi:hypothetical protein
LKRFIDDVAVEVIEAKLMSSLDGILSPLAVVCMPRDQLARIAGESEDTRTERDQLNKQLEVLRDGLETCKRFVGLRISGGENVNGRAVSYYLLAANALINNRLSFCFCPGN